MSGFRVGDKVHVRPHSYYRTSSGRMHPLQDATGGAAKVIGGPDSDGDIHVEFDSGDCEHISPECLTLIEPESPSSVVTIDLDDEGQVRALRNAINVSGFHRGSKPSAQADPALVAALKKFAEPKPQEPTDLSARMLDKDRFYWARCGETSPRWMSTREPLTLDWDDLTERFGPLTLDTPA